MGGRGTVLRPDAQRAGAQPRGEAVHPDLAHAELVDPHLTRTGCEHHLVRFHARYGATKQGGLSLAAAKKALLQTATQRLNLLHRARPLRTLERLLARRLDTVEHRTSVNANSSSTVEDALCERLKGWQADGSLCVLRLELRRQRTLSLRAPCTIRTLALCNA